MERCNNNWQIIIDGDASDESIVRLFLFDKLDFSELSWRCQSDSKIKKKVAERIGSAFSNTGISRIIEIIKMEPEEQIAPEGFPWVYDLEDALYTDIKILAHTAVSNDEIGLMSPRCRLKSEQNTARFGQCHIQFLSKLGLVSHDSGLNRLTPLGEYFSKLNLHESTELFTKLTFRFPIIRNIYRHDIVDIPRIREISELTMKKSVVDRRLPTIRRLVSEIEYEINRERK